MNNLEKNNVLALYGILILAVSLLCAPFTWPMIFGLLLLITVQIASPSMRRGKNRDEAYYQHLFYIGRTIWSWAFISTIATSLAGFIVYTQADNSIYDTVVNNMMNGVIYDETMLSQALMDYIQHNFKIVMIAAMICIVPMAGFLIYRIGHGMRRALKLLAPARPFSWF